MDILRDFLTERLRRKSYSSSVSEAVALMTEENHIALRSVVCIQQNMRC